MVKKKVRVPVNLTWDVKYSFDREIDINQIDYIMIIFFNNPFRLVLGPIIFILVDVGMFRKE